MTRERIPLFVAVGMVLCHAAAPVALAQNQATASGSFNDPAIWSQGVAPSVGDAFGGNNQTVIQAGNTVTLSGGTASVDGVLEIARAGTNGATGIFRITGGTFVAPGNPGAGNNDIGQNGTRTGILDMQGGLASFNRNVYAGTAAGNTGIVTSTGGVLQWGSQLRIGHNGTGIGSITGGVWDGNQIALGQNASSNAVLHINGGSVMTDNWLRIGINNGAAGNATVNVNSGGKLIVDQDLQLGQNAGGGAGSRGVLNITGGVLNIGEEGNNGVGGGGNVLGVGQNAAGVGFVNVSGGSLNSLDNNQAIQVGVNGRGFFNITGGDVTSQGNFNVAQNLGSFGSVNMTGGILNLADSVALDNGGSRDSGDNLVVGLNGTGFFNVTGGVIEFDSQFDGQSGNDDATNRQIQVGQRADSIGSMHVGGTAVVHGNELTIAEGSNQNNQDDTARSGVAIGVYTQTGGSAVFDGTNTNQTTGNGVAVYISQEDDSTGTLNMEGGHLVLNGDLIVADSGVVTLHTAGTNTRFATVFGASNGSFNQTGGLVDIGNGSGGGDDFFLGQRGRGDANITGGTLNIDRDFILGNQADTIGTDGNGAGFGTGVATIGGNALVNVNRDINLGNNYDDVAAQGSTGTLNIQGDAVVNVARNFLVGDNGNGTLIVSGLTSPLLNITGNLNIGINPNSVGAATLSGGTLRATNVQIGSPTNTNASLTQTGGVLIVDGQLITQNVETAGTASGYVFSGGVLTRSTNDPLVITGDLVVTNLATVTVNGGTPNVPTNPADPFSGGAGSDISGITLSISEGARFTDADGNATNGAGAGIFDFTGFSIVAPGGPVTSGILWFGTVGDPTGGSGGDNIAALNSTFLDNVQLTNIGNLPGTAQRISEFDAENNLGPGLTFDSAATNISYYSLINGNPITPTADTGNFLGLVWTQAIPEPSGALLVLLGGALLSLRRRR